MLDIIRNEVHDAPEFLSIHPGGANIMLKYAGKSIHTASAIADNTPPAKHFGSLDAGSAYAISQAKKEKRTQDEIRVKLTQKEKSPLSRVLNVSQENLVAQDLGLLRIGG